VLGRRVAARSAAMTRGAATASAASRLDNLVEPDSAAVALRGREPPSPDGSCPRRLDSWSRWAQSRQSVLKAVWTVTSERAIKHAPGSILSFPGDSRHASTESPLSRHHSMPVPHAIGREDEAVPKTRTTAVAFQGVGSGKPSGQVQSPAGLEGLGHAR
jgi:hypothetical protein